MNKKANDQLRNELDAISNGSIQQFDAVLVYTVVVIDGEARFSSHSHLKGNSDDAFELLPHILVKQAAEIMDVTRNTTEKYRYEDLGGEDGND